jgi:hypothetical protein
LLSEKIAHFQIFQEKKFKKFIWSGKSGILNDWRLNYSKKRKFHFMEYMEFLITILKDHGLSVFIIAALIVLLFRSKITIEYPKR